MSPECQILLHKLNKHSKRVIINTFKQFCSYPASPGEEIQSYQMSSFNSKIVNGQLSKESFSTPYVNGIGSRLLPSLKWSTKASTWATAWEQKETVKFKWRWYSGEELDWDLRKLYTGDEEHSCYSKWCPSSLASLMTCWSMAENVFYFIQWSS